MKISILGLTACFVIFSYAKDARGVEEKAKSSVENTSLEKDLVEQKSQSYPHRNGFFDLALSSNIQFNEAILLTSNYGFVVERDLWFAPPYTLESQIHIGFQIPRKKALGSFYTSIALRQEYNFLPNDGKNKYIPGVILGFGLYFGGFTGSVVALLDIGLYYKMFISDNFALMPQAHFSRRFVDKNAWELSLNLRKYF